MRKKKVTVVVLGAFLILVGMASLAAGLGDLALVVAILAVAAGVLILANTPSISMRAGWLIAAAYLIVRGLVGLFNFNLPAQEIVLSIAALAAGLLLLIKTGKYKNNMGYLLFFIWLSLVGLTGLASLVPLGVAIDILALVTGVLLIVDM